MASESTNRQICTVTLFCAVYIAWGLTDSIQAPFYPIEAEAKGATVAEYGFVFGVIHLAIFFSGPIFGRFMPVLGVRNVYIFGVITTGICALLFGFLGFVKDKVPFLTYSYLLRIMEGVAEAASWSAVFSMLLSMFPNNVATVYSFTEASFSFSEMIGPTLGALLYSVGGFVLPFEICGALCLVTGLTTILVIPRDPLKLTAAGHETEPDVPHEDSILRASPADNNNSAGTFNKPMSGRTASRSSQHRASSPLLDVLRNPDVILALTGTVFSAAVQGLLEACLEHYLEQFNLSITRIGLTFLALSVPYFVASPMWGYVCDHLLPPESIQAVGKVIIVAGFLVMGPAPYLPLAPDYNLLVVGLGLLGVGTAAGLVASFSAAQKAAIMSRQRQIQRNSISSSMSPSSLATDLYPAISGVWTSSFALGNFIGPSLGGLLTQHIGFRNATLVFQVWGLTGMLLDFYSVRRMHRKGLVLRKVQPDKIDLYERL